MKITAGKPDPADVLITLELLSSGGINISLESSMKKLFGNQIINVVKETLEQEKVANANVEITDNGALDFIIKARVITAINRARKMEGIK